MVTEILAPRDTEMGLLMFSPALEELPTDRKSMCMIEYEGGIRLPEPTACNRK